MAASLPCELQNNGSLPLLIAVPPNPVVVFDESGKQRKTFVGPYQEGASLTLICDAFRGEKGAKVKLPTLLVMEEGEWELR